MAALQVAASLSCPRTTTCSLATSSSSSRRRTLSSLSSASISRLASPSLSSLSSSRAPASRRPLPVFNIAQKPNEVETDARSATATLDDLVIPSIDKVSSSTQSSTSTPAPAPSRPVNKAAAEAEAEGKQIFASDVKAKQKRPYFFNREWTSKDIQYVSYMTFVHGLCLFAPATFSWNAFGVFVVLYVITGMLGITLSYHRHLSHKSFVLPKWLEYFFAYCGAQAVQGPPMEWVSAHRIHHRHCDTQEDPHTPYEGFWHSHMGWLLDDQATQERVGERNNIADMINDPFYNFIENTYTWHVVASAVLLYAIGGFPWLVWGFAVRAVWVYHITWFVNSASHVWGYQSWNTGDLSRNNWWVGILAFGEGWHNNHHAFEYSCRHGLEWWQYDPTWYTVKLLEAVGLAKKLRYPSPDHMSKLTFTEEKAVA